MDDNKVIRQLIRVNLELEGLEVVTASDGAECLEVVHQVRPDLVTLDVVMPRLDGLRTAERLRADPRTHDLPLAIISACTQYEVEAGLEAGVDAFLAKPFDPAELVSLVRRLIEGRRGEGSGGPASPAGGLGLGLEAPLSVTAGHDLALSSGGDEVVSMRMGNEHGSEHGLVHGNGHAHSNGHAHGNGHAQGSGLGHGHGHGRPGGPGPAPGAAGGPLVEPVAE